MTTWQAAYRDHGPAVLAYLRGRLRPEDAEDILQETFVRAIRSREDLDDVRRLRPYLLTIAHNLMINAGRRPAALALEAAAEPVTNDNREPGDDSVDLHRVEEHLAAVLEDMTPTLRTAFELGVLRQEPYREIARQTGWNLGQVKINVYRARHRAIDTLRRFLMVPAVPSARREEEPT